MGKRFVVMMFAVVLFMCLSFVAYAQDEDEDGIQDEECTCVQIDNCPGVYNPEQGDCDDDGIGDECDPTPGCPDTETDVDTSTDADTDTGADTETDEYILENCTPVADDVFEHVTGGVLDNIRSIINDPAFQRTPNSFMTVGDSLSHGGGEYAGFLGNCTWPQGNADEEYFWIKVKDLRCFPELSNAVEFFNGITFENGDNPYTRESIADYPSRTAPWALTGSPTYLQQEIDYTNAQYALITFGTNNLGVIDDGDQAAIDVVVDDIMILCDELSAQGVVPVVISPPPRADGRFAQSEMLSDSLREAAMIRELPFADWFKAALPLDNYGAGSDGVHPLSYTYSRTCTFDSVAMTKGMVMHNYVALKILDNIYEAVVAPTIAD